MGWNYAMSPSGSPLLAVSFSQSKGPAASGLKDGQCAWSTRKVTSTPLLCLQTSVQLLEVSPAGQVHAAAFGPNYLNNFLTSKGKLYIFTVHEAPLGTASGMPVSTCLWVDKYGP